MTNEGDSGESRIENILFLAIASTIVFIVALFLWSSSGSDLAGVCMLSILISILPILAIVSMIAYFSILLIKESRINLVYRRNIPAAVFSLLSMALGFALLIYSYENNQNMFKLNFLVGLLLLALGLFLVIVFNSKRNTGSSTQSKESGYYPEYGESTSLCPECEKEILDSQTSCTYCETELGDSESIF